jgi:hypothetical protein
MRATLALGLLVLLALSSPAAATTAQDVDSLLAVLRQDRPLPALAWLQRTEALNPGFNHYRGHWRGMEVEVETRAPSRGTAELVYSLIVTVPKRNCAAQLRPIVIGHYGRPQAADPGAARWSWDRGNYRFIELFYQFGDTHLSIGYR